MLGIQELDADLALWVDESGAVVTSGPGCLAKGPFSLVTWGKSSMKQAKEELMSVLL